MIKHLKDIFSKIQNRGPLWIAVINAHDNEVLESVNQAYLKGLIYPVLIGNKKKISQILDIKKIKFSICEIIDISSDLKAACYAVDLVKMKKVAIIMKGMIRTDTLLKAILDSDFGIKKNVILSHVYLLEIENYNRLIIVTDAAININPNLAQKVQILQNAIDFSIALENKKPNVAILSALELVSLKLPETIDASCLVKMGERGQIKNAVIEGPLALDDAISSEVTEKKKINSKISGKVDIFLVPNLVSGNIFAKALVYLANAKRAGLLLGASVPVVLDGRADSANTKLNSIALGVYIYTKCGY